MTSIYQQFATQFNESADETVMLSRRHCHAKNVSSIVVGQDGNCLTRLFLAWPGHQLFRNQIGDIFPVGIHDHRYSVTLNWLHGRIKNDLYEVVDYYDDGVLMNAWLFKSRLSSPKSKAQHIGNRRIQSAGYQWLNESWPILLPFNQLHNVWCDPGPCAWAVREGDTVTETTHLYTVAGSIAFDGLYESFECREQIIEHMAEFEKLCQMSE